RSWRKSWSPIRSRAVRAEATGFWGTGVMDDGMYVLVGIAAVLYLLVGPGLGIAAFFRGKGVAAEELAALRQRVEALAREIATLRGLGPQSAAETVAPAPAPEPVAAP